MDFFINTNTTTNRWNETETTYEVRWGRVIPLKHSAPISRR